MVPTERTPRTVTGIKTQRRGSKMEGIQGHTYLQMILVVTKRERNSTIDLYSFCPRKKGFKKCQILDIVQKRFFYSILCRYIIPYFVIRPASFSQWICTIIWRMLERVISELTEYSISFWTVYEHLNWIIDWLCYSGNKRWFWIIDWLCYSGNKRWFQIHSRELFLKLM